MDRRADVGSAFDVLARRCRGLIAPRLIRRRGTCRQGVLGAALNFRCLRRLLYRLAGDHVARAFGSAAAISAAPAPPAAIVSVRFGGTMRALLFLDQRLPVGDRDLIIIGMNFA